MSASDTTNGADKQYDRAITLIQYHVQLYWLIFSAFLLTETVLLGAIAAVAKDGPDAFVFGGAILGLLLILPWWAASCYNHALYTLRVHEARVLEPNAGTFFTNGKELIDKGVSPLDPTIRIPCLARLLAPRRSVLTLIIAFTVAFFVILVTHWPTKWRPPTPAPNNPAASIATPKP